MDVINGLHLPRYGLGNYERQNPDQPPTATDAKALQDLSRAGKRLMGFCRTNLFKRLESSGRAFLLTIERHILRNYVFLHAIESDLPLPIGPQGAEMLDARTTDTDETATESEQVVMGRAGWRAGRSNASKGWWQRKTLLHRGGVPGARGEHLLAVRRSIPETF